MLKRRYSLVGLVVCLGGVGLSAPASAAPQLTWEIVAGVRTDYNSDWLFSDETDTEEWAPVAEVDAQVAARFSRYLIQLESDFSHVELDHPLLPDDLVQYRSTLNVARESYYGLTSLSVRRQKQSLLLNVFSPDGLLGVSDNFEDTEVRLSQLREVEERTSLSVFLGWRDLDFQDRFSTVERDKYQIWSAGATVRHELTPKIAVNGSVLFDEFDTVTQFPVAFGPFSLATRQDRKIRLYGPALSIEAQLDDYWSTQLTGSVRRRETRSLQRSALGAARGAADEWDFYGQASIRRDHERSSYELNYTKSFRPSESLGAQLAERDSAQLLVRRQLTEGLRAQLGALWLKDGLPGSISGVTTREIWQANAEIQWQVTRRLSTTGTVRYQLQEFGAGLNSLDRELASVAVRYRLGRL